MASKPEVRPCGGLIAKLPNGQQKNIVDLSREEFEGVFGVGSVDGARRGRPVGSAVANILRKFGV